MLRWIKHEACPHCFKEITLRKRTTSRDDFIKKIETLYGKGSFDMTDTLFTKTNEYVTLKCNECGRYFTKIANSLLRGSGCPYHRTNTSKLEKDIVEYIASFGTEFITNDRVTLGNKHELDIYMPSLNTAIEFDGLYWHSTACKTDTNYHLDKTLRCEDNGIRLIHIFEDEWRYKRDICKSMLNNLLNIDKTIIFAKECVINGVMIDEEKRFLNENHIEGYIKSDMSYGLYHNNTLVSLISMRKYNNYIEIMRLCDKLYTDVVNGYEALLRHIKSEYHPDKIIACVNRRFNDGKIYEKIGFMLKECTDPDFFYVDYRRRYDKHSTVNKEAMQKIYDCGYKIYEL